MNVHHLLTHYGYLAVFVLVGLESLGIPLPGETILITAGIYAGTTHKLSIWGVFAVAAAGAIIGDNIGFLVGDKGGYRLLRNYGHYVRADEAKIKVGRYVFDRQGPKVVFFGRFVSVLRTYAAFLAGTLKMHWRKFLPYNAAGGIVWAGIYAFAAYGQGNSINKASKPVDIGLAIAAAAIIITTIIIVRRQAGKLTEKPKPPTPGPSPNTEPDGPSNRFTQSLRNSPLHIGA